MTYITPARYRTMGFGIDLSDVEDIQLASQIGVAARLVNRFCNLQPDYDFRGGTITDERHVWYLGNYMWPGPQKVYLDKPPVKAVTSFNLWVTNTQYLTIPVNYLHYDKSRNMLEPVIAASSIGVWSYTAIPVAGYRDPEARVSYTYGYEFPVSKEIVYPDGGTVYRAQNGNWVAGSVSVYKNNVEMDDGDYSVDLADGTVTLDALLDDNDVLSIDYTYAVPSDVVYATGLITTQLLGSRAIAAQGMMGLSGISVEEIEIRQSRDSQSMRDSISGLAAQLLQPYVRMVWGGS